MREAIKRHLGIPRKEKLLRSCGVGLCRSAGTREVASFPGFVEISDMPPRRTVRVAEVLRKELAACMSQSLDLEGLIITISSVELPPDMRQAYIYVSTLNPETEQEQALTVLN